MVVEVHAEVLQELAYRRPLPSGAAFLREQSQAVVEVLSDPRPPLAPQLSHQRLPLDREGYRRACQSSRRARGGDPWAHVTEANPAPTFRLPSGLRHAEAPRSQGPLGAPRPTDSRTPPSCRCPRHRGGDHVLEMMRFLQFPVRTPGTAFDLVQVLE